MCIRDRMMPIVVNQGETAATTDRHLTITLEAPPDALESVSYTHLDVYKRQSWLCQCRVRRLFPCCPCSWLPFVISCCHNGKCIEPQRKTVRISHIHHAWPLFGGSQHTRVILDKTLQAVSYTHLDVYKRQHVRLPQRLVQPPCRYRPPYRP